MQDLQLHENSDLLHSDFPSLYSTFILIITKANTKGGLKIVSQQLLQKLLFSLLL